jgi:hypothetical protein
MPSGPDRLSTLTRFQLGYGEPVTSAIEPE